MSLIRRCREAEHSDILAIINAAATAYRGVIPPDRWHDPYMTQQQYEAEIEAGVVFWGCEQDGTLVGVMGIQAVREVDLIRHAYVLPGSQRRGVGALLIRHLQSLSARKMLVGTWSAATWAIEFYRRYGFELAPPERTAELLRAYWNIPERQIATSVVLAHPPLAGQ